MKLYGSKTSPFVRRLRLVLENTPYEFVEVNIFDPNQRNALLSKSPTLKVPFLEDGGQVIWDSRVIFNYLQKTKGCQAPLTWDQENLMTCIDDLCDTLVQLLLTKRSEVMVPAGSPLAISHGDRIKNIMPYLEKNTELGAFDSWNFLSMCLYSTLDWVLFRDLTDFSQFPRLVDFHKANSARAIVKATDPRG